MSNDLRVRVANLVSVVSPPGITDAQMSNNIADYCEAMGIDTSGSNQAVLDRFTQHIWDDVHAKAKAQRRRKKLAQAAASIDGEVDGELGT